jgi:endoglucanase
VAERVRDRAPVQRGVWPLVPSIRKYLDDADIDWGYWSVNGTESTGTTRTLGTEDTFGFLDVTWTKPASRDLTAAITPVKQHP